MKLTTPSKTRKVLAQGALATTTSTTIYTVPAGQVAEIKTFIILNGASSAFSISVNLIAPGGSQGVGGNFVVQGVVIPAKDVLPLNDVLAGAVIDAGWSIMMQASSGGAISYTITGEVG